MDYKIKNNLINILIETVSKDLFSILFRFLLAYIVISEIFGYYAIYTFIFGVFYIFSDLASEYIFIKEDISIFISNFLRPLQKRLVIINLIFLIVHLLFIYFFTLDNIITSIILLTSGLSFVFKPSITISRILLASKENFKVLSKVSFFSNFFSWLICLVLFFFNLGILSIGFQPLLSNFITSIFYIPHKKVNIDSFITKSSPLHSISKFNSQIIHSLSRNIFLFLNYYLGILLLTILIGPTEVGLYFFVFSLSDVIPTHLNNILNRSFYKTFSNKNNDFGILIDQYLRIILFFLIPSIVGIFLTVDPFVTLFYSIEWQNVILYVRIYLFSLPFQILNSLSSTILYSKGLVSEDNNIFTNNFLFIKIPFSIVLTLVFGTIGFLISTIFSNIILTLKYALFIFRYFKLNLLLKSIKIAQQFIKASTFMVITYFFIQLIADGILQLVVGILMSIITYFSVNFIIYQSKIKTILIK